MSVTFYIILGLVAGIVSGFMGVGGATIIIPVMVYIYGMTQHEAQGTTLALMVLPIGLLAALKYYQYGSVNLRMAMFICIGFFIGGYIGASLAQPVPEFWLRRIFGVLLLFIAARMIFYK